MTHYTTILFDLDGTLTDPGLGITNAVRYALDKYGIDASDRTALYRFIGPPLRESFQQFYGFSAQDAEQAVAYFREYYNDKGLFENNMYDGIERLLQNLKALDKTLLVATSKPEIMARRVLEHFGLIDHFLFVGGATLDSSRDEKDAVIRYTLERTGVSVSPEAIMVGDRKHDVLGAKKFGLGTIGVLYGYGTRDELNDAGAVEIAESVTALGDLLAAR